MFPRMRKGLVVTLLGASLLLTAPGGVGAKQSADPDELATGNVITGIRLWFWAFSGWGGAGFGFGSDGFVWPEIGGSAGVEIYDHYLIEAGGSKLMSMSSEPAFELFLRGGAGLDLLNGRNEAGKGWRIQLIVLGGYRFLRFSTESDGHDGYEDNHCLAFHTGFEAMRYSSTGFGVGLRLMLGASLPVFQSNNGWNGYYIENEDSSIVLDTYLNLSFAF